MTKIKLIADIFLTAAWIVVLSLGAVLRDWALVGISAAATLLFANLVWYDIIKLDRELPKYVISLKDGDYYGEHNISTCKAKAKMFRSRKAASKAMDKLIVLKLLSNSLPKIEEVNDGIDR